MERRARAPYPDSVDLEVLRVLAEDCGVAVKNLAARLGLSVPSVRRRLRRLRSLGVLGGCRARVDPEAPRGHDLHYNY